MITVPCVAGSETSEDAAILARPTIYLAELRVHSYIVRQGERGATDQEIEAALEMRHETASARRHGLRQQGLVRDSGMRRNTPRGRQAIVWVAGADRAIVGTKQERVARPSPKAILAALGNLRDIVATASEIDGPTPGVDLEAVRKWLESLVRSEL